MPVHDSMTSRRELLGRLGLGTLGLGLTGTPRVWAETAEETPAGVLSYRNARLVMPDQQVMDGGIRIEDGQIVEVGPAVRTGEDLAGAWISPGFVDAGCTVG